MDLGGWGLCLGENATADLDKAARVGHVGGYCLSPLAWYCHSLTLKWELLVRGTSEAQANELPLI